MAKKAVILRNEKRRSKAITQKSRRDAIKAKIKDKTGTFSIMDKVQLAIELASLPRDGARVRYGNRCKITGRKHAYYRKFGMSRIKLRDLASSGQLPGVTKSSW